jgi:hypothetical protein
MIEYAKLGKYALLEYGSICYMASRFDNVLNIDLNPLSSDLMNAMTNLAVDQVYMKKEGTSIIQWEPDSEIKDQNAE